MTAKASRACESDLWERRLRVRQRWSASGDMTDWAAVDRLLLRDRWIVGGCVAAIAVLAWCRAALKRETPDSMFSMALLCT